MGLILNVLPDELQVNRNVLIPLYLLLIGIIKLL